MVCWKAGYLAGRRHKIYTKYIQNIPKIYPKYTQNIPKIVGKKVIESSLFGTASGRQTILGLFWTLYRNSRNQKRNRNTESTVFGIFDLIFFADKPGYTRSVCRGRN